MGPSVNDVLTIYSNVFAPLNMVVAMHIYGKKHLKIFFPGTHTHTHTHTHKKKKKKQKKKKKNNFDLNLGLQHWGLKI